MKRPFLMLSALLMAGAIWAGSNYRLSEAWATEPVLATCESVLLNPADNLLYVSCIDGLPAEKNGTGFIAKVDLDGKIHTLKWAVGLNAPKGIALLGDSLFASDIDELVQIDLKTGKIQNRYPAAGAVFLNDVAVDGRGCVYVSDSSAENGGIYRLKDGRLETWLVSPDVHQPNGLYVLGDALLAGDARNGKLNSIDLDSKEITLLATTDTGIDGLKPDGKENWFTSNWKGRTTLITKKGKTIVLMDTTEAKINSADFEYLPQQKLLLLPTFFDNRLVAYKAD